MAKGNRKARVAFASNKKGDPKAAFMKNPMETMGSNGRGKRIRTSGPCLPKTVLYQAELLPDRSARRPGSPRRQGGPLDAQSVNFKRQSAH